MGSRIWIFKSKLFVQPVNNVVNHSLDLFVCKSFKRENQFFSDRNLVEVFFSVFHDYSELN